MWGATAAFPSPSSPSPRLHGWPPALGRIAAGYPLEAIEDSQRDAIASLLGSAGRYALRVGDDAMDAYGIQRGDIVIVQSRQAARRGDIVVALVDDEPPALHRVGRVEAQRIQLDAGHPTNRGRELAPERVSIQGKVVGQLRYHSR